MEGQKSHCSGSTWRKQQTRAWGLQDSKRCPKSAQAWNKRKLGSQSSVLRASICKLSSCCSLCHFSGKLPWVTKSQPDALPSWKSAAGVFHLHYHHPGGEAHTVMEELWPICIPVGAGSNLLMLDSVESVIFRTSPVPGSWSDVSSCFSMQRSERMNGDPIPAFPTLKTVLREFSGWDKSSEDTRVPGLKETVVW